MRAAPRNVIIAALFIVATLAAVAVGVQAQDAAATGRASAPANVSGDSSSAFSEAERAALFGTYCATCHEGPGANAQAPSRDVMRRMSAEQVLDVLEIGAMRARAAERSRAQRRALAEYVSGKPLAAEAGGGAMPKSAFCGATPARPGPLAGPAWNGWGHGITNARFQSADAAGMKADFNIIDLDALAVEKPYMANDLPSGAKRLLQRAKGYVMTILSGVPTYQNGEATGELPGKLIRGPQTAAA